MFYGDSSTKRDTFVIRFKSSTISTRDSWTDEVAIYFPPSESTFATTDAKDGRPSDPLRRTVSQARLRWFRQHLRSRMYCVTTHDHGGILRVGQESYRSWIGDCVDAAQLDVDFEAHVRKVLGLG